MMESKDRALSGSIFERHAQTVIGAVLLALLLWAGNSLLDVRDRLGRIEVHQLTAGARDVALDRELMELRSRMRALELQSARSEPVDRVRK